MKVTKRQLKRLIEASIEFTPDELKKIKDEEAAVVDDIAKDSNLSPEAVKYAIIDLTPTCIDRFELLLSSVITKESNLQLQYYIDGIFVLGREELKCTLPTKNKLFLHQQIKYAPKKSGGYIEAIKTIKSRLGIKE